MLTELKAYSAWRSAPELPLNGSRAETDFIQVRDIKGLDPVKAAVGTIPFGAVDGASYVGSSVLTRNILLTLHTNPDWLVWTHASLRKLLYSYFMPKKETKLVFYSDDMAPVEISGIVESVEPNIFTKDPEIIVSIICPQPYFKSLNPIVVVGEVGTPATIDYNGSLENGFHLKLTTAGAPYPTDIAVQIGDPSIEYFAVEAGITSTKYFELSSVPTKKYVQNVDESTGVIINLLDKVYSREGASWPSFQPGENEFAVITDNGAQDWVLSYYELYGGL